jgi:hypothetical protein
MSGNGCHLYYRLNALENDDQSKVLLKSLISGLGDKFDNNVVKIDRSVFNASRITKVVGTKAYKGQKLHRPPLPNSEVNIMLKEDVKRNTLRFT